MSSFLHGAQTPCPRRSQGSTLESDDSHGCDILDSLRDDSTGTQDDTENIDFTTEIKAPLMTRAKPRRKTRALTTFAIHSDTDEKPAPPAAKLKPAIAAANRKTSLLAQPAQRFRPRVSFAPSPLKHSQRLEDGEPRKRSTRPSVQKNNELLKQLSGNDEMKPVDAMKRGVRRDTVYIPPDDTTVASVFMGLFSPLKSNSLDQYISENTQTNTLESQIARKQQAKWLRASTATTQAPLQPRSKVTQETCDRVDIPGKNGGKENLPPGMVLVDVRDSSQCGNLDKSLCDKLGGLSLNKERSRGIFPSTKAVSKPLAAKTGNTSTRRDVESGSTLEASVMSVGGRPLSTKANPLNKSNIKRNRLKGLNHDYPLAENITNPSMYDDNWLSHQEMILTQLINGLLHNTSGGARDDSALLRHELLALYQSASFTDLYKRLQASLMYGALSIPKDVLMNNSRLSHDLGMKRKFIDIWLQTYDPKALKAALETVTGRVIPAVKMAFDDAACRKALRKRLANFLNVFLVQNQDMDSINVLNNNEFEVLSRSYRRTVLRSMMMVILLDKARSSANTTVSRCLFLSSAPHKSSLAVLQALTRFLLPSCGDINKAIGQLDCQLSYQQHPMEEYSYAVSNLAVDLRDGVKLTRVVEMLLYPDHSEWPLSQRLKVPSTSRAVKVFNVRTALDALAATEGRQIINNVRPEDIVNGHREKTIALLWGLVSTWGLSELVNIADLWVEICQLKQKAISTGYQVEEHEASNESAEPAVLLQHWASLVTQLRGATNTQSCNIENAKVYELILDEYEPYLYPTPDSTPEITPCLETRLRALGCSAQFTNLFSPSESIIFDTSSTTAALAFLCSRLLPVTKRVRAATVLQTAWRRVLHSREMQRRATAAHIARQCAAVVQTRDRILWAKGVIVQWWRVNRARRGKFAAKRSARNTRTALRTNRRKSTMIPRRK